LIEIIAEYDYVLRIKTKIETKTSRKPQILEMVYDPGAGTTTISEQVALDAGYQIKEGIDTYVEGIGGSVKARYTIVPNMTIGGVGLGPVYAHVVKFHEKLAQRTNALLGMNVLSWFKITQDCRWDNDKERYATAVLQFEPKFDITDIPSLDCFFPGKRGQRFGSAFHLDF